MRKVFTVDVFLFLRPVFTMVLPSSLNLSVQNEGDNRTYYDKDLKRMLSDA